MDLMGLERKALTLEFIRDGRQVVAAVQQWLAWLNDGGTGNVRFLGLSMGLKRIEESIDLAAGSCRVAAKYREDIAKGRAPSFDDAFRALEKDNGAEDLWNWEQLTEGYLEFLTDFIETATLPTSSDQRDQPARMKPLPFPMSPGAAFSSIVVDQNGVLSRWLTMPETWQQSEQLHPAIMLWMAERGLIELECEARCYPFPDSPAFVSAITVLSGPFSFSRFRDAVRLALPANLQDKNNQLSWQIVRLDRSRSMRSKCGEFLRNDTDIESVDGFAVADILNGDSSHLGTLLPITSIEVAKRFISNVEAIDSAERATSQFGKIRIRSCEMQMMEVEKTQSDPMPDRPVWKEKSGVFTFEEYERKFAGQASAVRSLFNDFQNSRWPDFVPVTTKKARNASRTLRDIKDFPIEFFESGKYVGWRRKQTTAELPPNYS